MKIHQLVTWLCWPKKSYRPDSAWLEAWLRSRLGSAQIWFDRDLVELSPDRTKSEPILVLVSVFLYLYMLQCVREISDFAESLVSTRIA